MPVQKIIPTLFLLLLIQHFIESSDARPFGHKSNVKNLGPSCEQNLQFVGSNIPGKNDTQVISPDEYMKSCPGRSWKNSIQKRSEDHTFDDEDLQSRGYHLVGYHGTCSKYKDSIEEKISITSNINHDQSQLGRRFYTADDPKVAEHFSTLACREVWIKNDIRFTQETTSPMLCKIFAKSSALNEFPKVYVPSSKRGNDNTVTGIWDKEDMISSYEEELRKREEKGMTGSSGGDENQQTTLDSNPEFIRFSKIFSTNFDFKDTDWEVLMGSLQAAWPKGILDNLIAKCAVIKDSDTDTDVNEAEAGIDVSGLPTVGYEKLFSKKGEDADELWGEILGGEVYKPMEVQRNGDEVKYKNRNDDEDNWIEAILLD